MKYFVAIIIILFSFFAVKNLGNIYLWQDEGETAFLATTISISGYPKASDGNNFLVADSLNSSKRGNDMWRASPWLQHYLTFLSFRLTGAENTFTARLPFAIFGIFSLLMFIKLVNELFKDNLITAIASLLFVFSIPILLHIRQCRYYSLTIFFSLATTYFYIKSIASLKKQRWFLFSISGILLYHSNQLAFFILFVALFIHFAVLITNRKRWQTVAWKEIIISLSLCFLFTFPFFIYLHWGGSGKFINITDTTRILTNLREYAKAIFEYSISLVVLVIGAVIWTFSKHKFKLNKINILLLTLPVIISPLLLEFSRYYFFRYIIWALPFGFILMALAVRITWNRSKLIGLLLAIYLSFYAPYNRNPIKTHVYIKDFLYELNHDYDGPVEGIVKYLNENGKKDEVVAINYDDPSIMFYTKMKVIVGSSACTYIFKHKKIITPDWVIIRNVPYKAHREEILEQYLSKCKYKEIVINYPNIVYENREEPSMHLYRTVTVYPFVKIYKKIQ